MIESKPPFPPFDAATAAQKVRGAENAWNSRDPAKIALAYTPESVWRNRSEFINGRDEIVQFLTRKWEIALEYRLIKEVWAFEADRIGVRFAYEYHNPDGQWFRAYGNENWQFDSNGLMAVRHASINDVSITQDQRLFHWPLGPRPEDHKSLSELGL